MPLSVITGSYRIVGASPDGDSVRFYPDDPDAFTKAGLAAKLNAQGGAQLRMDAIDALETHYTPPHATHPWRQPAKYGEGAATALLDLLGFSDVVRDHNGIVTSGTPDSTPGYILTRFADVYGRPVSLAYAGTRRGRTRADGKATIELPELKRSVNYQLLNQGLVYPTFYSKLYVDFREELARVTVAARERKLGLWADDATLTGFAVRSAAQLSDDVVILPKLFRRLAEYLTDATTGKVDLTGFHAFLTAHGDDQLYTVPHGQATSLATLIKRSGSKLTLTIPPEQIVFIEQ
jgi:endonuclease YncB( thermonuclease family)